MLRTVAPPPLPRPSGACRRPRPAAHQCPHRAAVRAGARSGGTLHHRAAHRSVAGLRDRPLRPSDGARPGPGGHGAAPLGRGGAPSPAPRPGRVSPGGRRGPCGGAVHHGCAAGPARPGDGRTGCRTRTPTRCGCWSGPPAVWRICWSGCRSGGRSGSASPPAAGWTARPARSSTIRCWAGGTSRRGSCCAPAPGCRSMWTGTRGRWRTRNGCSGGPAGARCTCSPGTSSTRPSPPVTRCTTGRGPRRARSPISRWRAAPSAARAAGPAASRRS